LLRDAADSVEAGRNDARMRLARFYLARGMAAEAKGLLDVVLASERDQQVMATARMLRGLSNLIMRRPEAALTDLTASGYEDPQFAVLRSMALSRLGRHEEARAGFDRVDADAAGLPVEVQRLML